MVNWREICINPDTTIFEALEIIDKGSEQIALVLDGGYRLVGTVTDGDIRRGLLAGISLQESVQRIMNVKPTVARANESHHEILTIMKNKSLLQIPVVDANDKVVGVRFIRELLEADRDENWVVLMAGGLGTRLRPLTENTPKPLLKVGDKPILEQIITRFAECGFKKFFVTVHYKAEMVKEYFGKGDQLGVSIDYLNEPVQLGTAGALGLLPERPAKPLFVMNADLVTDMNFAQLLSFHKEQQAHATMCVHQYDFQVPYGVVSLNGSHINQIDEKPTQSFFVNAGIYTLEPDVLDYVPKVSYLDMPTLFTRLIEDGKSTAAFPIHEEWFDIGRIEDYVKAQKLFGTAAQDPNEPKVLLNRD